jgi:hypothetical protein
MSKKPAIQNPMRRNMSIFTKRTGLVAIMVLGIQAIAPESQAQQFNFNPGGNPNFVPGMTQAQYMLLLQQAAAARAAAQNQLLFPAVNPALPAVNPYAAVTTNPYAPSEINPAAAGGGYGLPNPYNPYYPNPYLPYGYGAGSVLMGAADVLRAYGSVINSQEQSRITRELGLQARLDTKKKKFDLEMYIKANTPTFTEEQAKIAKMTLKRIQTNSTEAEIVNGRALNLLLDDLRRHPGKKSSGVVDPLALSAEMLGHLNVTKNSTSLGILRNGGDITWPVVFQEYFPADQLRDVAAQAKVLVKNAEKGKIDANVLKDLRIELDKMRDQLVKKLNEIPTSQYLDAKRFLNDFDEARIALERGEAMTQVQYQKWATGGKSLPQLVDYMIDNGLRFTTSTQGDEFAYRAVYSGMAAMDVALNSLAGSTGPGPEPMPEP